MRWDDLQYVLAIVREGTLSRAATSLGVTHTTVGRRLVGIESDLNVRLFDRTEAGYVPTPAGQDIADVAEKMESELLALEGRVLGRDVQLHGRLRVSTVDFLFECFSEQFASFIEDHPQVELTVSMSNAKVSLVRRDADVALRVTDTPRENLLGRKVADLQYAVYGGKALVERIGPDAPYGAFPWLHSDERENPDWMDAWLAENAPDGRVALRASDGAVAARNALNAGIGLHLLPSIYAAMDPGLVQVGAWESTIGLWLLTLPELRTNIRVRAFMDQMFESLRSRLDGPARTPTSQSIEPHRRSS